jgi:hypothetical protein
VTEQYLQDLEELYIDDGWYRDGDSKDDMRRIDYYYNQFAMHHYGIIYAKYQPSNKERFDRFRDRSRTFAIHYQPWFADTGSNVPYARCLI